jgi:hypothetical protein
MRGVPRWVKLLDGQPVHDFTKDVTIEIKRAALQLKILHPLSCLLLFTKVIPDTPGLTASTAIHAPAS